MSEPPPATSSQVYGTPAGHALIRQILVEAKPQPIEPHDYQLEGISRSLDGDDLIVTMATGTGKTGFYCFLMIVVLYLSENPDKVLGGRKPPKNPGMLLICPTKALQGDMVSQFNAVQRSCSNISPFNFVVSSFA